VGFGGISVGGISSNQEAFKASLLPGTMHLPHTHNLSKMAFSKGQPLWGAHLADNLELLIKENGAETIAAVIVEPMQGSAGVIVPPQGYLEKLRSICDMHHVLLIFDEVITGFGRLGEWFSPNRFGVIPDMITFAKGVTSGVVPLGGVLVRDEIYHELMTGPDHLVEFFHGYTYSGHPLACAAGLAAINVYEEEGLLVQARKLEIELENAVHSLRNEAHIIDIRNIGMAAAIEFEMRDDQPSLRAMEMFKYCFDHGVMVRYTGDIIAIGPALVCDSEEIEVIVETVRAAIRAVH
jgi:beta-alanine--pyruvate transaminase